MISSWLPFNLAFTFPSFTPPLSIQRRFISFILKRFLGHLLKPGQLDVNQIDAQIGNGFVEVKDLELDGNAINLILEGQPVQLQSGTLAAVTARIPWPNPFTSTVGLSLTGLRLVLAVSEPMSASHIVYPDELAGSFASVAESFIHEELTEKEEFQLRQTNLDEQEADNRLPGSIDPFLNEGQCPQRAADDDPEGVSIFAGLFENLLARFDFSATDTHITLVSEGCMAFNLRISSISYFTETSGSEGSPKYPAGETRTVHIEGLTLTHQDFSTSSPVQPNTFSMAPTTTEDSDSEIDDETQMMMSQSIFALPLQPIHTPLTGPDHSFSVLHKSASSSMYESAISAFEAPAQSYNPQAHSSSFVAQGKEWTILAVPEPVIIRMTTPPFTPHDYTSAPKEHSTLGATEKNTAELDSKVMLDISIGTVAMCVDATHIQCLVAVLDAFKSSSRVHRAPEHVRHHAKTPGSEANLLDRISLELHVKNIVLLFLSTLESGAQIVPENDLMQFYARPLTPPSLRGGCVRFHIDTIETAVFSQVGLSRDHQQIPPPVPSLLSSGCNLTCEVVDISVLIFRSPPLRPEDEEVGRNFNLSYPVLVTDTNLSNSYQSSSIHQYRHIHPYSDEEKCASLPIIDVIDWTSEQGRGHGTSLRPWRTRAKNTNHRKVSSSMGAGFVSKVGLSTSPTKTIRESITPTTFHSPSTQRPAISVKVQIGQSPGSSAVTIEAVPLHLFLDLEAAQTIKDFAEVALSGLQTRPQTEVPSPTSDQGLEYIEKSPRHQQGSSRTVYDERRRLEELVLEDLDLAMDYRQSGDITPTNESIRVASKKRHGENQSPLHVDVFMPLLRLEVRVPPPWHRLPRSGVLILDIHDTRFSNMDSNKRKTRQSARFDEQGFKAEFEEWFTGSADAQSASFQMQRVVVAYAGLSQLKAEIILSLGPISDVSPENANYGEQFPPHTPLLVIRNNSQKEDRVLRENSIAFLAWVPSVHIVMDKVLLDGLQVWVDDISQWAERLASTQASGSSTRAGVSRSTSLIGSRYFVQRAGSGSTESEMDGSVNPGDTKGELVVKVLLSEAFIRLIIPMGENPSSSDNRFLDLLASELDALVEVKPEGKDEVLVSLNLLGANIAESSPSGYHGIITTNSTSMNNDRLPVLRFRFRSVSLPGTTAKESKIRLVLHGVRIDAWADTGFVSDLACFAKAPPGTFESVVPSERTQVSVNVLDSAFFITPPSHPSMLVLSLGDIDLATDLGKSQETAFKLNVADMSILLCDDVQAQPHPLNCVSRADAEYWMSQGYALLATINDLEVHVIHEGDSEPVNTRVAINGMSLIAHLCADSISGITAFATDFQRLLPSEPNDNASVPSKFVRRPPSISGSHSSSLLRSLDEQAFRQPPVIGPLPDLINDDLPNNPEYLDASFGAAAGLRPLEEDEDEDEDRDGDEYFPEDTDPTSQSMGNITSRYRGETVKMFCTPVEIMEHFYDTLSPGSIDFASEHGDTCVKVRAKDCDVHLLLYDGYDWKSTRREIQEEIKRVKRRLAKIRQLLANGQSYDPNADELNTMLFNSVYVGLDSDAEGLEREALIAVIDDELRDESEVASESSWQSFNPDHRHEVERRRKNLQDKSLNRSKGPSIEFSLRGMTVDFDQYLPDSNLASRLLSTIKDLEILDHIKTSTWSTFLTELRSDTRGNIRETDSNMVRIELQMLHPYQGHMEQEARLKAKLLPLRLHVDQDALDFLKKFFGFEVADVAPSQPSKNEIFFRAFSKF